MGVSQSSSSVGLSSNWRETVALLHGWIRAGQAACRRADGCAVPHLGALEWKLGPWSSWISLFPCIFISGQVSAVIGNFLCNMYKPPCVQKLGENRWLLCQEKFTSDNFFDMRAHTCELYTSCSRYLSNVCLMISCTFSTGNIRRGPSW